MRPGTHLGAFLIRPVLVLQARRRERTPRSEFLGLKALVIGERWNPSIDFAVHFVALDKSRLFQSVQHLSKINQIVGQDFEL